MGNAVWNAIAELLSKDALENDVKWKEKFNLFLFSSKFQFMCFVNVQKMSSLNSQLLERNDDRAFELASDFVAQDLILHREDFAMLLYNAGVSEAEKRNWSNAIRWMGLVNLIFVSEV